MSGFELKHRRTSASGFELTLQATLDPSPEINRVELCRALAAGVVHVLEEPSQSRKEERRSAERKACEPRAWREVGAYPP